MHVQKGNNEKGFKFPGARKFTLSGCSAGIKNAALSRLSDFIDF
jgi:hypothetical protein